MSKKDFPYYWRTKDGSMVKVDDMDIDHLRNVLKMLIRMAAVSYHQKRIADGKDLITHGFVEEGLLHLKNDMHDQFYEKLNIKPDDGLPF